MADPIFPDSFFEKIAGEAPEVRLAIVKQLNPMQQVAFAKDGKAWRDRKSGPSAMSSFGHGMAQGATVNFGDEATGAIQALGSYINPDKYPAAGALVGTEDKRSIFERYLAEQASAQAENDKAEQAHPGAYFGGNLTGGAMIAPALGVGEGVAGAVGAGAAQGAASGYGSSKGSLLRGDIGQVAEDTGVGAVAGSAVGLGGHAVSEGLTRLGGKVAKPLGEAADWLMGKHMGASDASATGAQVFDSKVGVAGRTRAEISDNLNAPKAAALAEKNAVVPELRDASQATNKGRSPSNLADRYENNILGKEPSGPFPPTKETVEAGMERKATYNVDADARAPIKAEIERLRNENDVWDFQEHDAYVDSLQGKTDYNTPNSSNINKARKAMGREARLETEDMGRSINVEKGEKYIKGNEKAHKIYGIQDEAKEAGAKDGTLWNKVVNKMGAAGMTAAGGVLGYASHSPAMAGEAAIVAGLAYVAKTRGGSTVASAAKTLSKNPQALGKFSEALINAAARSPEDFEALHDELLAKHPMYRKLLGEVSPDDDFSIKPGDLQDSKVP